MDQGKKNLWLDHQEICWKERSKENGRGERRTLKWWWIEIDTVVGCGTGMHTGCIKPYTENVITLTKMKFKKIKTKLTVTRKRLYSERQKWKPISCLSIWKRKRRKNKVEKKLWEGIRKIFFFGFAQGR